MLQIPFSMSRNNRHLICTSKLLSSFHLSINDFSCFDERSYVANIHCMLTLCIRPCIVEHCNCVSLQWDTFCLTHQDCQGHSVRSTVAELSPLKIWAVAGSSIDLQLET